MGDLILKRILLHLSHAKINKYFFSILTVRKVREKVRSPALVDMDSGPVKIILSVRYCESE